MSKVRFRLFSLLAVASVAVVFAGLFVVSGASGKSGNGSVARAGAQTFRVNVDGGATKAHNEEFLAYFPSVVRVHPGDTVVFRWSVTASRTRSRSGRSRTTPSPPSTS